MKKTSIILIVIILLLSAFTIFQFLKIKRLEHTVQISSILTHAPKVPDISSDSLYISQYLIGKNIDGWGNINPGEVIKMSVGINTNISTPTKHPLFKVLYNTSKWGGNNYDFDPDNNEYIFDSAIIKYRLKKLYPQEKDIVGLLHCNHTYDPVSKSWKTNINLNSAETKTFSPDLDFDLR